MDFKILLKIHISVALCLYEEFMSIYQHNPSEQQVFELLLSYEKACEQLIPLLRQFLIKSSNMSK